MSKHLQPILLGLTLTIGIAICWGLTGEWLVETLRPRQFQQPYRTLAFASKLDVPILIAGYQRFDMDGNEVANVDQGSLTYFDHISPDHGRLLSFEGILPLAACHLDQECWYLIDAGDGHCYFEGYDRSSGRVIGTIGMEGFHKHSPPRSARFPLATEQIDSRSVAHGKYMSRAIIPQQDDVRDRPVFINAGHTIYRVEPCERHAEKCFTSVTPIRAIVTPNSDYIRDNDDFTLLILTERQLIVLKDGDVRRIVELPKALRDSALSILEASDGTLFVYRVEGGSKHIAHMYAIAPDGLQLWQKDVEVYSPMTKRSAYLFFVSLPMPAFFLLAITIELFYQHYLLGVAAEQRIANYIQPEFWIGFTILILLSTSLAILCHRWQRHYHAPKPIAWCWALLVFLGGPPAYLAFLAHRYWPPRETLLPPHVEPEAIELTGREILA